MNWVKAMLLMVVLGAILYGVNLVLNKSAPSEAPQSDGNWASDGPITPVTATPGVPASAAPGAGHSTGPMVAQQPAAQQPAPPAAYPSGNFAATGPASTTSPPPSNPPTSPNSASASATSPSGNYLPSPPPASSSVYGQSGITSATNTNGMASDTPNVPPPAAMSGYTAGANQPTGYQPSTRVGADATHEGVAATPVGMTTTSPASPAANSGAGPAFENVMENVMATLHDGHLAEGLQRLTLMYDDPQLSADQTRRLNELLGRLAGTVVYSQQHLLLPAYEVRPGDRLESIAAEYQVPAALLAKINRVADGDHLPPGQKLKVMRGPFMALVNVNQRQVTLVVQQCYAGRFTLSGVGKDAAGLKGVFKIDRKSFDAPNHPSGFAGQGPPAIHHWMGFTDSASEAFGFCGAADGSAGDDHGLMLNSRDAEDLFDILSVGSSIVIR